MTPEEIAKLTGLAWFRALDSVRQDVILSVAMNTDRLNEPILIALEQRDWIAAAYELCNAFSWNHQVGWERCKELGDALEHGKW